MGLFLDLFKAFGRVYHPSFLAKIERVFLRGIFSYFLECMQVIAGIGEYGHLISSNMERVNVGAPQGSILGPLLFLIYTNALSCNTPMRPSSQLRQTHQRLRAESSISRLHSWFNKVNNLKLKAEKTKLVSFTYTFKDCVMVVKTRLALANNKILFP